VQDKNRTESLESADYRGPLLLMRFTALRLAGSNSQYTEVVKHGKPTVLTDYSKQRNESARLFVSRGSGKKLTGGDSKR